MALVPSLNDIEGQAATKRSFFFIYLYNFVPLCPFPCTQDYCCQLQEQSCIFFLIFFFILCRWSPFHIPNGSLMRLSGAPRRRGGAACHRPLLSPQRLATLSRGPLTDLCWLTNQELNTANLCRGPPSPKCVLCFSHWARQMIGDSVAQGSPSPCNHSSLDSRCCTPL